jgi:hypothetical protein
MCSSLFCWRIYIVRYVVFIFLLDHAGTCYNKAERISVRNTNLNNDNFEPDDSQILIAILARTNKDMTQLGRGQNNIV